jgi:hypothetical protein
MNNLKKLYKIAGIATLLIVVLIPIQIFFFGMYPPPDSARGFFELFNDNWILGLLSLDLLYVVNNTLMILVYLGLFAALNKTNLAYMTIALVIGFIGIASYYSSTVIFEMKALSHQFRETSSIELKEQILSSGNLLLLRYKGTAFDIYYILNALTLIIASRVMLMDNTFSKTTAVWGLIAGGLMIIPSTAGMIGLTMSLISLIPWIVFSIMIAKRFFKLYKLNE